MPEPDPPRLALAQVTLCAVTSVNVDATVRALEKCLAQAEFADCLLLTDTRPQIAHPAIRWVPIKPLTTSRAYSEFMLKHLADQVMTKHCLVVQWDGHILDAERWDPAFLEYDYVGASWPQFDDDHDVGNGGFSLRSRRLLVACQSPRFADAHPEDVMIGRTHRRWLEEQGLRFAPLSLANRFSTERAGDLQASFGYHGAWHMPRILGSDAFWEVYRLLDERSTIRHDFWALLRQTARGRGGFGRALSMLADRVLDAAKKGK